MSQHMFSDHKIERTHDQKLISKYEFIHAEINNPLDIKPYKWIVFVHLAMYMYSQYHYIILDPHTH